MNHMNSDDIGNLKEGLLLVVSGPAGTGKGTVIKALLKKSIDIVKAPSVTTRKPRKGEKNGINYYFKSKEEFIQMVENNEFIEWVEYCGNFYGTPNRQLKEYLNSGKDVVIEKEVKGAIKIKEKYPNSILIFLLPPSFHELKRRIMSRGTEDVYAIDKRLERAKEEIGYIDKYDYVVINDSVVDASNNIICIIKAEKLKVCRNINIAKEILQM